MNMSFDHRRDIMIRVLVDTESRGRGRDRRRDDRDEEESGRSIILRKLSFSTKTDEIRRIFSKFGEIRDVYIPLDHYSKRPRGFAFVEYLNPEDAR